MSLAVTPPTSPPTTQVIMVMSPDDVTMTESEFTTDSAPRTLLYEGYQYTYKDSKTKITYRCSIYRRSTPHCRGRLHWYMTGRVQLTPHTCAQIIPRSLTSRAHLDDDADDQGPPPPVDLVAAMEADVDRISLACPNKTAAEVWTDIREEFLTGQRSISAILTRDQVMSRVYRVRRAHHGTDDIHVIERPPLCLVQGTAMKFFQFMSSFDDDNKNQRIIGWAHPHLISLLKYKGVTLYVDGTFRCVPKPFYQCVVIMVYDQPTTCYVPVFYVLATCKSEESYNRILGLVGAWAKARINPGFVTCDFEQALHNSVRRHFENATVLGCLFHFKQAIRKRMKKLHISDDEVDAAMTDGVFDVLTVVPRDKIQSKGIPWVVRKIKAVCKSKKVAYSQPKWDDFWNYFVKTWLKQYDPKTWNVHGISEAIVNRTNNPLERYNKELNRIFTVHPSMNTFVTTIEKEARKYVDLLNDVRGGISSAPSHAPPKMPNLPRL